MMKKLSLLLCLGIAVQAPLQARSYDKTEYLESFLKVSAGVTCTAGMIYLIATYPQFFGELAGALLRGLTDSRCYHCNRYHYGRSCHHVTVVTHTYHY